MNLEKYIAGIDEIFEKFQFERVFYAKNWIDCLMNHLKTGVVIFGCGSFGKNIYFRFLKRAGVPVLCFCDNNASNWGAYVIDGLSCIAPDQLNRLNTSIVVAVCGHEQEIVNQCSQLGISDDKIFIAPLYMFSWCCNYRCSVEPILFSEVWGGVKKCAELFTDDYSKKLLLKIISHYLLDGTSPFENDGQQYFIPELPIRHDEAFVDAGAFVGDTLSEFIQKLPEQIDPERMTYYAFECSRGNSMALQATIENLEPNFPVEIFDIACWNKREKLIFPDHMQDGGAVNCIKEGIEVQADLLDDILAGKRVSWIKMDIEGAELQALEGCSELIRRNKPRLSICIYHELEHLYKIPLFIHSLRNDYRLLLRHHSEREGETVLYAY